MNWDDLRIFLAVSRSGGLAQAGAALKIDHTTVARRLGNLETAVGARLVVRSPRGARLTEAAPPWRSTPSGSRPRSCRLARGSAVQT